MIDIFNTSPLFVDGQQWYPLDRSLLDYSLGRKIKPPFKLTAAVAAAHALMNASISPVIYRSAASAREAKRLPGGCPPITNRGGKGDNAPKTASFEAKENLKIVSIGKRGGFTLVRIPVKDKGFHKAHSFIDWVNFTFKTCQMPLVMKTGTQALTDDDYIHCLSQWIYEIFGIGITDKRLSGMNFYEHAYNIGNNGEGLVCIGGQQDSVMVTMKGQGLMASSPGWEVRLKAFLDRIPGVKLTRVDLASDNYNSKTTLDDYLGMYRADMFTNAGRPPNVECLGNWERPNGKGRTLYIGSRTAGKLLRIYEKGLQLANGFHERFPNWVRVELELKNTDRIIPLDVLLFPGQYLAGAYPALNGLHKMQNRIETQKKTVQSTFERALKTVNHQFGKYIYVFNEILGPEKTLEILTKKKHEIPKRLNFDTFEQYNESDFKHTEIMPVFRIHKEIPISSTNQRAA